MSNDQPVWLVTGGAGFIGGNFIRQAIEDEAARIINLDALTYAGNLDTLADVEDHPDYQFICGSINDSVLLDELFGDQQIDAVINFAAESHVDRSIDGPADFIQTNVVGTMTLLQAALDHYRSLPAKRQAHFRFLHISTDEVYGSLGESGYFTETTAYAPNSPYSASKAASDHLVRAWHHTFGLPVLTTNCSNNYGPWQFPEKLIPLMISKALAEEPLPVYGDGLNVRDWLHVSDHCRAIRTVLDGGEPGEVYNVGGDAEMTNIDVVRILCTYLDELAPRDHGQYEDLITFVSDRPGHDRRYAIDSAKLQRELGWTPEYDFESGMAQTVQWYLSHQDWTDRILDGSYRGERLGAA